MAKILKKENRNNNHERPCQSRLSTASVAVAVATLKGCHQQHSRYVGHKVAGGHFITIYLRLFDFSFCESICVAVDANTVSLSNRANYDGNKNKNSKRKIDQTTTKMSGLELRREKNEFIHSQSNY